MFTGGLDDKWHRRFMDVAILASAWSKDPSTKVGAAIVDPIRKRVVSIGYNGLPHKLPDVDLHDRESKYSRIIHAEMNALLHAREPVEGYILYVTPLMICDRCAVHVIQAGIRLVVVQPAGDDARWQEASAKSLRYLSQAQVPVLQIGE